jgi:dihydroorotate dehydrogenase
MEIYRGVVRPILFLFPPEDAQRVAKKWLSAPGLWGWTGDRFRVDDDRLRVRIGTLELPNPIGLAAGFDKDAELLPALAHFGFGYLIPGSIMPKRTRDNPRPRLVRLVEEEGIINCVSLPSVGVGNVRDRLAAYADLRRSDPRRFPPIVANINGFSEPEEWIRSHALLEPLVDAIEMSSLCPNLDYKGPTMHEPDRFAGLLRALGRQKHKPLFVKLRNYWNEEERENRMELARVAADSGVVDGLTMSGMISVPTARLSQGRGGLSGPRILPNAIRNVRELYGATGGRLAIKALGGISSGADAFAAIAAGASTVELYTSFVYQGPGVVRRIAIELLALLDQAGIPSVSALRGSAAELPGRTIEQPVLANS